ncbi:MAG: outer membrane protein assembly factor BamE [Deltaproteobacteria bacterium]|jgi:outer membrane protein assembly factor BamE (lipoprotein component of BamABCDE complex)|nr:outer membrane protein assembly factor BamE [Deltaproteobacteria bacterium]
MKRLLVVLSFTVICLGLSACGNKQVSGDMGLAGMSVSEIQEQLIIGKTSKKEVEALLGTPSTVSKGSNGETWHYTYSNRETKVDARQHIPLIGGLFASTEHTSETKGLTVNFNKAGYVASYGFTSH